MALTPNGRMTGRAASQHHAEVRREQFEQAFRQREFNEYFQATALALSTIMGDKFDAWYDSYPETMSKADFLPIMIAKIADLQSEPVAVDTAEVADPAREAGEIAETLAEFGGEAQNLTLNLEDADLKDWQDQITEMRGGL